MSLFKKNKLYIVCLLLSLVTVFMFLKGNYLKKITESIYLIFDIKDNYSYEMNRNYEIQRDKHMSYANQADIVMFGNSITEMAEWNELLGRSDIVNRGIGGDITEGMLNRIESVTKVKPEICFFLGGINDIIKNISQDKTISNVENIISVLIKNNIKPVIQSVIYTGSYYQNCKAINEEVSELNNELSGIAKTNEIAFIDLNKYLSDEGYLKNEYTYDGLHLNAKGYKVWAEILNDFLSADECQSAK